jgi:hypothetical protein
MMAGTPMLWDLFAIIGSLLANANRYILGDISFEQERSVAASRTSAALSGFFTLGMAVSKPVKEFVIPYTYLTHGLHGGYMSTVCSVGNFYTSSYGLMAEASPK